MGNLYNTEYITYPALGLGLYYKIDKSQRPWTKNINTTVFIFFDLGEIRALNNTSLLCSNFTYTEKFPYTCC